MWAAQAMAVLVSTARENPQAANAALKTGLENLGLAFGTQQVPKSESRIPNPETRKVHG
jgi:hypothetical protein